MKLPGEKKGDVQLPNTSPYSEEPSEAPPVNQKEVGRVSVRIL